MTDDDTDNDRMERANRIREMREGRRGRGAGGDTDDTDDEPTVSGDGGTEADHHSDAPESRLESDQGTADSTETATHIEEIHEAAPAEAEADTDSGAEDHGFEFERDGTSTDRNGDEEPTGSTNGATTRTEKTAATTGNGSAARAQAEQVLAEAGIAQPVSPTEVESAADRLQSGTRFEIPDQATSVTEEKDSTLLEGAEGSVAAARAAASAGEAAYSGEHTRVLEYALGDERFCLDIDYIEEIVELENMTRVPNSPSHIEGVVDLRGQVTAIINPKDALDIDDESRGDLVIVFDSEEFEEQGHLGWVVDGVRQVTPVAEDDVNESPDEEADHIHGVINRDEEDDFIVWTAPDLALNSS